MNKNLEFNVLNKQPLPQDVLIAKPDRRFRLEDLELEVAVVALHLQFEIYPRALLSSCPPASFERDVRPPCLNPIRVPKFLRPQTLNPKTRNGEAPKL